MFGFVARQWGDRSFEVADRALLPDRRHDTAQEDMELTWNRWVHLWAAPCQIAAALRRPREWQRRTA
jgi:hypothetical protein